MYFGCRLDSEPRPDAPVRLLARGAAKNSAKQGQRGSNAEDAERTEHITAVLATTAAAGWRNRWLGRSRRLGLREQTNEDQRKPRQHRVGGEAEFVSYRYGFLHGYISTSRLIEVKRLFLLFRCRRGLEFEQLAARTRDGTRQMEQFDEQHS